MGEYNYSNAGYTVAAYMAERVAKRSWEELMHMDHQERQRWVDEIVAINTRLNSTEEE